MKLIEAISNTLNISVQQIETTIKLLDQGASIPFISRYRKEITGNLNEVQVENIKILYEKLKELEKRKHIIIKSINDQNHLDEALKERINNTWDSTTLEDIYLPFKPKKQTKSQLAKEKNLEGLAKIIMAQNCSDIRIAAEKFINADVTNIEDAIEGSCHIIAEWINENESARKRIRQLFQRDAILSAKVIKGKETEGNKYQDYFNFSKPLKYCSSHQILAIRRGESEKILRCHINPCELDSINILNDIFVNINNNSNKALEYIQHTIKDAYNRLLKPSIETEYINISKEKADDEAIKIFATNLKQLLLASPLAQKRILAIDPGYRTGCKVVCLDHNGNLLHNETIYPHPPQNEKNKASSKLIQLVSTYDIDAIAIGNGTAGRETELFVTNLRYDKEIKVFSVSESGASIYSASKIAREEFPQYDITVRGAISIGRRLLDPLSELVKIDPKSIGVGQYQHDVDQVKLKKSLDQVVENCVNSVGVNLNTASKHLLAYISGLGNTLAQNIVDYRAENGEFESRNDLLKVPRLGEKAFEQCAGFLRIPESKNCLDNSAVHPESYHIVQQMADDLNCSVSALIQNKNLREKINISKYVNDKVGLPTLKDILIELEKPGRDPRNTIEEFKFDPKIKTISDLNVGLILPGVITNITNFGCFVDIGIKENGLVHISEISDQYVSNLLDILSIHQYVTVKILTIDIERKRIGLSMKNLQ